MLDFIIEKKPYNLVKKYNDSYSIDCNPFSEKFRDGEHSFDELYSEIDFKKQTISVCGSYISGHNGNSYGSKNFSVSWEKLHECLPTLKREISKIIEEEIHRKKQEEIKKAIEKVVNDNISEIMKR